MTFVRIHIDINCQNCPGASKKKKFQEAITTNQQQQQQKSTPTAIIINIAVATSTDTQK